MPAAANFFVLMKSDLLARPLQGEVAQGGLVRARYSWRRIGTAPLDLGHNALAVKGIDPLPEFVRSPLAALAGFERTDRRLATVE